MMKLLLSSLLLAAAPAWSCDNKADAPRDMITDSPRGARIAAALTKAQTQRSEAVRKRFTEIKADPRYRDIEKREDALGWSDAEIPARAAVRNERNAFMAEREAELQADIERRFPVNVNHTAYLCGSARLPDGHEINAGSSWSIRNARLPELKEVQFSGAEMHYILEHGQGQPARLDLLERLLELPPTPKVSGDKVGSAVSRLILADWN